MLKASKVLVVFLILLMAGACTAPPSATPTVTVTLPAATVKAVAPTPKPASCVLSPVIVPTRPATTPGYAQLDPSTGLHMTGTPQEIDLASYRLKVTGKVDQPLSLTHDDLRCMPKIQTSDVLICPGYFEDEANWAGVPLTYVLDLAGVQAGASSLTLVGADEYSAFVTLQQARTGNNYLAYEWEGKPIPILHGFPVRAVFPSLQGNKWVKWLIEIRVE
jgi:DMSO/TMAO reductase YedYZ molybdopterin-dependent catalytic subunit